MKMDLKLVSETLIKIINEAGKIILNQKEVTSSADIDEKAGDANFVTVFDVAVQGYLIGEISKAIPNAVFVAEEQENDYTCLQNEYCFVIDPIDGTTNFIHGYKHSSISVAMFSHGEVVLGAVYDPYLNEMFYAVRGNGAFLNGEPIRVSKNGLDKAVCLFGTSPYYKAELADKTFNTVRTLFLTCADVRRSGSAALDLAYIAAGRCDIFYEARLSPWDFAAGVLLITEAGGTVTQADGKAIDFIGPVSILAANTLCHKKALELVK